MKLYSREDFKTVVFKRDRGCCVVCKKPAVDAHHLLERKLFSDGGYYLDNGVSLCEKHHMDAEITFVSVEQLRSLANIKTKILPPSFDENKIYDKWGNEIKGKQLIPGPLFSDTGCQRMLSQKIKDIRLFIHKKNTPQV